MDTIEKWDHYSLRGGTKQIWDRSLTSIYNYCWKKKAEESVVPIGFPALLWYVIRDPIEESCQMMKSAYQIIHGVSHLSYHAVV